MRARKQLTCRACSFLLLPSTTFDPERARSCCTVPRTKPYTPVLDSPLRHIPSAYTPADLHRAQRRLGLRTQSSTKSPDLRPFPDAPFSWHGVGPGGAEEVGVGEKLTTAEAEWSRPSKARTCALHVTVLKIRQSPPRVILRSVPKTHYHKW